MFTREDAAAALMECYGRDSEVGRGLCYKGSCIEPDGVVVYFFEVWTNEGSEDVIVYRDNDGVNIM